MKNYIFGDTGGHAKPLFASLKELGVDMENYIIPEGIRIIHCGDLIHKGPSTTALLIRVDKLIRNNPGQWIQILGNHEFQHLEGSPYFWRCNCSIQDIGIIEDWFEEGLATAAFGIDKITEAKLEVSSKPKIAVPQTGALFVHGGLTYTWWKKYGQPKTPTAMAHKLNELEVYEVTAAGLMLGYQNPQVGPVWAIGNDEVFNNWLQAESWGKKMPFMQVHGHTTSYQWRKGEWFRKDREFKKFKEVTKLNPETRSVITEVAGNLIIGIDPGFAATADLAKQPFLTLISE